MIHFRFGKDRGYFDHGWLRTYHTFSFSEYYDPHFMGFGPLRVINEDFIEASAGFPTHGHRDMEIITYVLAGAVAHKDSTGGEGVITPGVVQKMTAGRGVRHSEFNGRKDIETHLYQIWIEPNQKGLPPSYVEKDFSKKLESGEPVLLVSPEKTNEAIHIFQDAKLWARKMKQGLNWNYSFSEKRLGWIQVARGQIQIGEQKLNPGDGAALENESEIMIRSIEDQTEILLFDMA